MNWKLILIKASTSRELSFNACVLVPIAGPSQLMFSPLAARAPHHDLRAPALLGSENAINFLKETRI